MQLILLLSALCHGLADIARAAWEILTFRKRSIYVASIDIAAPRAQVWELLLRRDLTYAASGLRIVQTPIAGRDNAVVATFSVKDKQLGTLGLEYLELEPERHLVARYLPEFTHGPALLGDNDVTVMKVDDLAGGGTRLGVTRELAHIKSATRIVAPMGVRGVCQMLKAQAEMEAGIAPAAATPRWWHHLALTLAAFGSFWLMFDWRAALMMLAIIAMHEGAHALAMLYYGLGVRLISFIPFFGGMAVARRAPANEWQRAIIALMGVGASLPLVLALAWYADVSHSEVASEAALLAAYINGANLAPLPGLDGSVVVQMLLRKVHPKVARFVALLMFAAFVAFAVHENHPIVWATVAFSLLVLVQTISFKLDERLQPTSRAGSLVLLLLFLFLCGAYYVTSTWTFYLVARPG